MRKQDLIENIENYIREDNLIAPFHHKKALFDEENSVANAIFPEVIIDTHLTSNVFVKDEAFQGEYLLNILKLGNVVFVNGFVKKLNSGQNDFAKSENLEYFPLKFPFFIGSSAHDQASSSAQVICASDKFLSSQDTTQAQLSLNKSSVGEQVFFNLFYFVES